MKLLKSYIAVALIFTGGLGVTGCGDGSSRAPTEIEKEASTHKPANSQFKRELPTPCNETRFTYYDSMASVSDDAGHGPDLGSSEWQWVISRKLGVTPPDANSDPQSSLWCQQVEIAIQGMHLLGFRDNLIGDEIKDHGEIQFKNELSDECQYGRLPDTNDLLFMFVNGELVRIDVSGSYRLPNGIGVGSSADEIQTKYGDGLNIRPNKYDATASDYSVKLIGEMGMLFEVSDKQVTRYRVGRLPEVNWVEGCR